MTNKQDFFKPAHVVHQNNDCERSVQIGLGKPLHWETIPQHPDSKVHGANMRPIWGRQDPGGPHVDLMNLAIWDKFCLYKSMILSTNIKL